MDIFHNCDLIIILMQMGVSYSTLNIIKNRKLKNKSIDYFHAAVKIQTLYRKNIAKKIWKREFIKRILYDPCYRLKYVIIHNQPIPHLCIFGRDKIPRFILKMFTDENEFMQYFKKENLYDIHSYFYKYTPDKWQFILENHVWGQSY